jgi:hypothetical protein
MASFSDATIEMQKNISLTLVIVGGVGKGVLFGIVIS